MGESWMAEKLKPSLDGQQYKINKTMGQSYYYLYFLKAKTNKIKHVR